MSQSNSQVYQSVFESYGNPANNNKVNDAPFILQQDKKRGIKRTTSIIDSQFILQQDKRQNSNNNNQASFILQDSKKQQRIQKKKSGYELDLSKTGKPTYNKIIQNKPPSIDQVRQNPKNRPNTPNIGQNIKPALQISNRPQYNYTRQQQQNQKPKNTQNTTTSNYNNNKAAQNWDKPNKNDNTNKNNHAWQNQPIAMKNAVSLDTNAPFIQYYEQNINLKRNQQQLQKQVSELKNRLNQQQIVRNRHQEEQLKELASGRKSAWGGNKQHVPAWQKRGKGSMPKNNNIDQSKVSHLLQIIDHYKQKLMAAQQQIKNLRRQKHLLQQDGKLHQKKNDMLIKSFQQPQGKSNAAQVQDQLRNIAKLYQIQKQRNKFNQADIRRLQTKIKTLEINKQQAEELRTQNRNLEEKLLRLTSLPTFSELTDKVDEQGKYKKLQIKYNDIKQKHEKHKKDYIKNEAELKVLRNQLIKANIQADQLSKQNIKMKQQAFDPVVAKLMQDQQLLRQVVYQIQNKKNPIQHESELQRQSYNKILLQKQALANELTVMRNKMNALQQNWRQRQRLSKIQKQQIMNTFKNQTNSKIQGRVMSKNGVAYTDDVSMFSQQIVNINAGNNYFDIFLGELHLLETMMVTNFNIRNFDSTLIIATIDFYNHNTETTRPVHGLNCNLQSQFSFKITQDEFFFKYLNKGTFALQIWGAQGNKKNLLGKATVDLKPLILKSRQNMAPVANSSAPIYFNQKVMGSINFVMRLRLPIFQQLQKITQLQQIVSKQDAPLRKLIIQIQEGRGFSQKSNTFVYFAFRLEDYYTKTFKGTNPNWNYNKSLQVRYNNDFKNYIRKNQLQLAILDDNAVMANEGDSDVVGSAYVSLVPLLQNRSIKERVSVMKGTQRVGYIDIKIFWLQTDSIDDTVDKTTLVKSTAQIITSFLTTNKITPDQLFDSIDANKTGMISYDQFLIWVPKLSSKITIQMASAYYNEFKQPLNKINFEAKLTTDSSKKTQEIVKQFSQINKMMSLNTQVIVKKQSLQDYLKGKDAYAVCLDIDKSQDGKINKKQLQKYFDMHHIQAPNDIAQKQQVNIVHLIKKYQSLQ